MLWNGLPNTASRSDLDTERTGNIPLVISAHIGCGGSVWESGERRSNIALRCARSFRCARICAPLQRSHSTAACLVPPQRAARDGPPPIRGDQNPRASRTRGNGGTLAAPRHSGHAAPGVARARERSEARTPQSTSAGDHRSEVGDRCRSRPPGPPGPWRHGHARLQFSQPRSGRRSRVVRIRRRPTRPHRRSD